jgi:hypothetical protein
MTLKSGLKEFLLPEFVEMRPGKVRSAGLPMKDLFDLELQFLFDP